MSPPSSKGSLSALFSKLSIAASANDYDQVLQIANDVLESSPNDDKAAKQKIIALIKLDKYKEAISYVEEATFLKSEDIALERGFCLYKLGRGEEARKVLENGSGRAIDHVRAQNVRILTTANTGLSNGGFCNRCEII
jgi:tetratricopeptide (TPR) repeat protein